MLTVLPLIGSLFVDGSTREKLLAAIGAPFALNVLILCNSRGAFLSLIGAGLSFVAIARGPTRKKAVRTMLLGSVVLYLLLGDPDIFNRFMTTFVGSEERDNSASSRLEFWQAGLMMLRDHPLGAGGGAFKAVHGGAYLSKVIGSDADNRSLHNGYLTEATDWGLQGLFLKLLFFGVATVAAYRTSARCRRDRDVRGALMGICTIAAAAGYLISCMFGSFLNNEWGYWVVGLLVRYAELYRRDVSAAGVTTSSAPVRQAAA
jgi:O-antigen ligase